MKSFDKLQIKIKKDLGIETDRFTRTYCGRHQLAAGGWCWEAHRKNSNFMMGSSFTVSELLKSKKLHASGTNHLEIFPD